MSEPGTGRVIRRVTCSTFYTEQNEKPSAASITLASAVSTWQGCFSTEIIFMAFQTRRRSLHNSQLDCLHFKQQRFILFCADVKYVQYTWYVTCLKFTPSNLQHFSQILPQICNSRLKFLFTLYCVWKFLFFTWPFLRSRRVTSCFFKQISNFFLLFFPHAALHYKIVKNTTGLNHCIIKQQKHLISHVLVKEI